MFVCVLSYLILYVSGLVFLVFFFKQKTAYEVLRSLVGSEMCIRDRITLGRYKVVKSLISIISIAVSMQF